MVPETEFCRRAERRAGEIIDGAERYAEEVSGGSEVYRDRVMGQLENWFQDSLISVEESGRSWAVSPCAGLRPGPRSSRRRGPTAGAGRRARPRAGTGQIQHRPVQAASDVSCENSQLPTSRSPQLDQVRLAIPDARC